MSYGLSRVRQFGMSLVIRMNEKKGPQMIVGKHSILKLPQLIKNEGISHVFLVTTSGMIKRGTLEELFQKLEEEGIKKTVYSEVIPDPTVDCVEKGVTAYLKAKCQGIVAIGGGSAIDCAKIIGARVVKPGKQIRQMRGTLKINKKLPVFFAVPTTAGTGSEATAAAVITDTIEGIHYKYPVNDLCLIPRYAILDSELTVGLPAHTTAITGMDALTHSIEAYTNCFASKKTKDSARKSVSYIFGNLTQAVFHGDDLVAREKMLLGAYYGGIAITNNFVGYVHGLAHALGALYGIPHGEANAILLPVVLEEFGASVYVKLSELAKEANIQGDGVEDTAKKFIGQIRKMNEAYGIPSCVKELEKKDYNIIIERAMREANPEYPVPQIWERSKFEHVLDAIFVLN